VSVDEAETLRLEALELIASAKLTEQLQDNFGDCALVGSAALNLMTWRDIDLYVPVERAQAQRFVDVLPPVYAALNGTGHIVTRITFNEEWALPRGDYGSGYYWGLRVRTEAGDAWKIDLWGWDRPTFERKLAELRTLELALAEADRELILRLKREAQELPGFRSEITSWDIYQFVLAGAGTTLSELRDFVAR
jgi:hypothetical protein